MTTPTSSSAAPSCAEAGLLQVRINILQLLSTLYPPPVQCGAGGAGECYSEQFLWIQKSGESAAARAHVESPVYQNSRVDCYVMFYYVKSGTIG